LPRDSRQRELLLLDPAVPLAPIPLVAPLPGVRDAAVSPAALLEPRAAGSPAVLLLEPMPLVPPAGGVLAVLSAAPELLTPDELALDPVLLEPVPAVPGVVVDTELLGVLFAADRSSPQPAIANASATLAAMVSSLVIWSALMM
jgi:hypothetical protein